MSSCDGCGDRSRLDRLWLLNELGNLACLVRLQIERPQEGRLQEIERRLTALRDRKKWE